MQLNVVSTIGKNTTLVAQDTVFGAKVNPVLIAQAVRVYLFNQRQGTSKVKTRSEINRTKKKWFKQKGTGNARHGARTPNIFVGGGVAHGPTGEQNWLRKMPATMRRQALISALSAQVKNLVVSDDLHQLDGKTASAQKMLTKMLPEAEHILIVLDKAEPMVMRSLRNLASVYVTTATRLTTYEVAYAEGIVLTKEAVHTLEKRLDTTRKEKMAASASDKAVAAEKSTAPVVTEKKKTVKKAAPKTAPKAPKATKAETAEPKKKATKKAVKK